MKYLLLSLFMISTSTLLFGQLNTDIHCAKFSHHSSQKSLTVQRTLEDARLNDYDVNFYHLDLEASNASIDLSGTVRIMSTVVAETQTEFVVELDDALNVSSVSNSGTPLVFTHSNDMIVAMLEKPYAADEKLDITITYAGTPPSGDSFFQGISNAIDPDWNQRVTWTLSEPFNARDWWPVKQVLTDKADSAYIYITVPNGLKAGASGKLMDVVDVPGNKSQYQWQTNKPIAYYLISMAISNYREYTTSVTLPGVGAPTPIVDYIYENPSFFDRYQSLINGVDDQLVLFSELFGTYPYADEKYGHALAPMGGGMEHQTMSTMSTYTFRLIAHELAHQWYGDMITCATWSDIWINEGFARYSEYLALEFLENRASADAWMALLQENVKLAPDGSVYIPPSDTDDPFRIFNGRLTYNKGGAILHTLRHEINNDELFFESLTSYSNEFKDSTATGADFRDFMSDETGLDLTSFFDDWYFGEGYPIYDIVWRHRNDSLMIQAEQSTSRPSVTPFFSTTMPIGVRINNKDTVLRFSPVANSEFFKVYLPGEVQNVSFDPDAYLIKVLNSIRNADVTSVNEDLTNGIQVYPNPASDQVTIVLPEDLSWEVSARDIQGRLMYRDTSPPTRELQFTTRTWPPGVYILEATSSTRSVRTRVVVRR